MPQPEIDARSGIGEPRAAFGVSLDRDARRHAVAEARRADGVAVIAVGGEAVELTRKARFDRIIEEARRKQIGGVVVGVFGDSFLAGGIAQHDAHGARAGGERNVIDVERAARDRLREGAGLVGEHLHGRRHGRTAGKLRERLGHEIGPQLEIAADLNAAHADRGRPVQRTGDNVACGIGDERIGVFVEPARVEPQEIGRQLGRGRVRRKGLIEHAILREDMAVHSCGDTLILRIGIRGDVLAAAAREQGVVEDGAPILSAGRDRGGCGARQM